MSSAFTLKSFARIIILTFVFSLFAPLLEILPVLAAPVAPKSNHLPQISIPVPGGVKVNTWNGNLFLPLQLVNIPGRGIPIDLSLSYNSTWFQTESNYGFGWQFSYNIAYEVKSNGDIVVVWHDGRSQKFVKDGSNYVAPVDTHDSFSQYESGKYKLVTKEGTTYFFEDGNHKKITKITDTNGNPISFQYNGDQLVSKIIDSANREVTLSYTDKKLTKITDPNTTPAREVNITYDTNKNLTRVTDPLGYAINFEYDTNHFLTKIKDKKDSVTTLSYANGVVANVSNDSGSSVYFGFDKKDFITSVIQTGDYNKHLVSRYDYDAEGRISKFYKVKDGNGNTNVQEFTWDANNNLTSFKDELGRVTSYTYDSKGNILSVVTPTGTSTYTYDPVYSRLTSEKDPNNNTTNYQYDAKGNLTKSIDAKGRETTYTYDANGDLLTERNARNNTTTFGYNTQGYQTSVTDPLTHVTTSAYDNAGRLLSATDANNNTLSFQYDINGNKVKATDATGKFETYTYDKNGNMTSKTDANLNTTTYEYDKLDRLIREVDAETNATLYVYNKLGLLEKLIDPKGNTTEYQYDWLGQLVKETDPEGKVTWHEYDAVGNKNKTTDPNGNNIYYTYDSSNRLTFVDYSDNAKDTTYTYDAAGNTLTESNSTVIVTRTYNELNQVTSVKTETNGLTKLVAYMYDEVGNRIQMLDPDNGTTYYTYDAANRLTELRDPSNQITKYSYDNGGRTTKKTLGNNSYTDYAYDKLNRLTTLTNKKSDNSVISTYSYTYDFSVNRTSMTTNGQTTNYTYDKAYRLTGADYPGTAFENFTYDPAGNRLTKVDQNGTTSYTYDKANKLLTEGTNTFTYDNNGNQKTSRGKTFEYDVQDSLKKVTLSDASTNEYTYYPDGRRLSMKNRNNVVTYYFYDGVNDLIETNASGTTQTRYTSSSVDGWLNMKQGSSQSYYLTDGLGSTVALLNSSQGTANTYSYDAFGKITNQTGSVNNSFTYTGRRTDWDTNQYHYRARYYDPVAGRFTQKDPAGVTGGLNTYIYALNNPVILLDKNGKHPAFLALFVAGAAWGMTEQLLEDIEDRHFEYEAYIGSAWGGSTRLVLTGLSAFAGPQTAYLSIPGVSGSSELSENYIYQSVRILNGKQAEINREQLQQSYLKGYSEGIADMILGPIFDKIPGSNKIGKKTGEVVKGLYTKLKNGSIKNIGIKGMTRIYENELIGKLNSEIFDTIKNSLFQFFTNPDNQTQMQGGSSSGDYAELALNEKNEPVIILQAAGQTYQIPINPGGNNGGGDWKIDWFVDKNMNHFMSTTYMNTRNINLGMGSGAPGNGSPAGADHYAARFEKDVYFEQGAKYEFKVRADDGYRLYIDNNLIEDRWWNGNHENKPDVQLGAGNHRIRLDYYEDTGNAHVELDWYPDPDTYGGVWLCRVTTGNYLSNLNDCFPFTQDVRQLGDTPLGNDTVKAIHIVGDWEAALFRHVDFNIPERNLSDMQVFTGNVADLGSSGPGKIGQNEATSLRVRKKDPARVTLFDLGDFNGEQFKTDRSLEFLRDFKFNDTAESVKVQSGYEAVICDGIGIGGDCGRTKGEHRDIREVHGGLRGSNNQGTASSITICEGSCPPSPMVPQNVIPSNEAQFATGNPVTFQWFGNAEGYSIEIWGGALPQKIVHWAGESTFYTKTDLQPSPNPYYWNVRSWNDWGGSGFGHTWTFKISHVPVQDINITAPATGEIENDYQFNSQIVPTTATAPVTYNWSPEPKSGQGTVSPVYNFTTPGEKIVKVTTTNPAGTFTKEHTININCHEGQYFVDYFNGTDLTEKSLTACKDTVTDDWGTGGPGGTGNVDFSGSGKDGNLTIPVGQVAISDTQRRKLTATSNAGATTITTDNVTGLTIGDEVMVIHMKGDPTGLYDLGYITAISGTTLTLNKPLINSYNVSGNQIQVVRIPNYNNLTVDGILTVNDWDTQTGGVLAFRARTTTVSATGLISATGKGYRGGSRTYGPAAHGKQGESMYILAGTTTRFPNWNGGGGGPGSQDGGAGAGGGSYASAGGTAKDPFYSDPGVGAPHVYGDVYNSRLYFGGAGGSGGTDDSAWQGTEFGGFGGNGGGIIFAGTNRIVGSGRIESNGGNGENHNNVAGSEHGGGAGGAGGSLELVVQDISLTNIQSNGGSGGKAKDGMAGNGGQGRTSIDYCNIVSPNVPGHLNKLTNCTIDSFSSRYSKTLDFTEGTYNISVEADDGVKVWIGEQLVIDEWSNGYKELNENVTIPAGTHEIKVEYYEDQGSAILNFNIQPGSNQAPNIETIPRQIVGPTQEFTAFDLDDYVTDESAVNWTITGNTNLQVAKDPNNVVTVTKPANWIGEETLTFKAKDQWNAASTKTALFRVNECNPDIFKIEYFNNEDLTGSSNFGGCTENISYDWGEGRPNELLSSEHGDGSSGDLTVATGQTQYTDEVRAGVTATANSGDTQIAVASATGFATGNKVLIIQMQGTTTGTYEFGTISEIIGNTITLQNGLSNSYTVNVSANSKVQIIKVNQYKNLTVEGTLTVNPWDGTTGGVMAFNVSENLVVSGTVNVTGKGYRGGAGAPNTSDRNGRQGESYTGLGSASNAANVGGGGGGKGDPNAHPSGPYGLGGAGAGHYGAGTNGQTAEGIPQSIGGGAYNTAFPTGLTFGSGGGGGGADSDNCCSPAGAKGGNGGGIILIAANHIDITGNIIANGENGSQSGPYSGAGGGGAGGSIMLRAITLNVGTNKVLITGGNGGTGSVNTAGQGSTGSKGRLALKYCSDVNGTYDVNAVVTIANCPSDNFSARYTKVQQFIADDYNISVEADDGVKLWIADQLVIDAWSEGYKEVSEDVTISEGIHDIKVEFYENQGTAKIDLAIQPLNNQAPVVTPIPNQMIGQTQTFTTFDLDEYVTDESEVAWTITGNTDLQVVQDAENVVTITKPGNWVGEETLTFKAKDQWNASSTTTAIFNVSECNLDQYKTEYFDNDSLSGESNPGGCVENISYGWGISGPTELKPVEHGDGSSGDVTVPTGQTQYTDAVRTSATATINANSTQINVASSTGFEIGNKVMVIQMQGSTAGTYEFRKVTAVNSNVITVDEELTNTYTVNVSAYSKVQILKVNQYKNLTVDGTLSVNAWNGTTGGVMAFHVSENLVVNGIIDATGKGYRGGAGHNTNWYGNPGESYMGQVTNQQTNHYNSGGSGGQRLEGGNGGGGGAGYNGGSFAVGSTPGYGGQPISNTDMNKLVMGGAGGAGGRAYSNPGGTGGNGGGIVYINANNIEVNGLIKSHGTNGGNGTYAAPGPENRHGHSGGGGGGAGGMVVIKGSTLNIGTNKITLTRGNAGAISGGSWSEGHGSIGSAKVEYCNTITGTASGVQIVQQATCEKRIDNFSARWTGFKNIVEEGQYKLDVDSDDGVRVWIDNNLVVDKWTGGIHQDSPIVDLTTGFHSIKVEYFEQVGEAGISLNITKEEPPAPLASNMFTGEYFNNRTLDGTPVFTNTTPAIDYGWGGSPFTGVNADNFSARWIGTFDFPAAGLHTFTAGGDDGIRIFVDDVLIIDAWVDQGYTQYQGVADLSAGIHEIKFEYYEAGGGANATLEWEAGSTIPVNEACTTNNNEYCATYFNNQTLSGTPVLTRQEFADLDRDWGESSPGLGVISNDFSGRWEGKFEFEAGNYIFEHHADDGIRAWIDNELFVDRWNGQSYNEIETTKLMTAGLHDIKVEFLEWGGGASVEFEWTFDGAPANNAPNVTQIPGQIINEGGSFTTINLSNYVTDTAGDTITWSYSGNTNLGIVIANNVATITTPTNFTGTENIKFRATDNGGLFGESTAAFVVNAVIAGCPNNQFSAKYFNNMTVSGTAIDKGCINNIAYDWSGGSPSGVNADHFSARYEGNYTFEAGTYTFTTLSDNAVRLWVDGVLKIDQWVSHSPQTDVVDVQMTAGLHAIKLEYFENMYSAKITLSWNLKTATETELLTAPWYLSGNNGASEKYQTISSSALAGKTTMRVTYNLHGMNALGGDASAIIFDQNGWKYISLSNYGQNGLNGVQTVDIPLSAFTGLNLTTGSTTLHTRFWYGSAFTVDITSIKVF